MKAPVELKGEEDLWNSTFPFDKQIGEESRNWILTRPPWPNLFFSLVTGEGLLIPISEDSGFSREKEIILKWAKVSFPFSFSAQQPSTAYYALTNLTN